MADTKKLGQWEQISSKNCKHDTNLELIRSKTNSLFEVCIYNALRANCKTFDEVANFVRMTPERLKTAIPKNPALFAIQDNTFVLTV